MKEVPINIYIADFIFECLGAKDKDGNRRTYTVKVPDVVCPKIPEDLIYNESAYKRAVGQIDKFHKDDAKKDSRDFLIFTVIYKAKLGERNDRAIA